MNSFGVSLYLTFLLVLLSILFKKKVGKGASVNVLFWLLIIMVTPGFVIDLQELFFWGEVGVTNITLFILLLFITAIPWISFDKWYKKIPSVEINNYGASVLSVVFIVVILSCIFSYIYIAPYALKSFGLGAAETRSLVNADESVLPTSILTTFAVGVSSISPFYIFFFFLSLLHPSLKKYSFWLFASSFIYIWVSMPFMSRDGFVTLPVFFIIFYLLFKKSLGDSDVKKVKRYFSILAGVAGSMLLIYSVSRFFINTGSAGGNGFLGLIDGTWGYIYQQPYVFDRTITYQHTWHGLSVRFPLIADILGLPIVNVDRYQDFETMFGTMLSEFYSIGGYWSLFVFTGSFVLIYYVGIRILIRKHNYFSVFLLFITYLIIEVTGLFYYRYGGLTFNWLFLVLTLLPFMLNLRIICVKK